MWRVYSYAVILLIAVSLSHYSAANTFNETGFVNATTSRLKILAVFGHPGKSHFAMFLPLLEELARRGHHITVLSHFPRSESAKAKEPLPTYRDISLTDSEIGIWVNVVDLKQITHTFYRSFVEIIMLRRMATITCNALLHNAAVKEFIKSNEHFDVMLTESFNTDCFLSFAHWFKAPYLSLSSHQMMPWSSDNMGNDNNPSYVQVLFSGFDEPMSFLDRISNTLLLLIVRASYEYWFRPIDQAIVNEVFGKELPKLRTIAEQSQALLVNTHSSLQGNRPLLTNIIHVGGIHISSKINPLPKDIAKFLDNAHEGVLYFNLGSVIKLTTMPAEKMDAILDVIGSIPHKVLWKWESDELPRNMSNVMAKKWLPQFDVLNHPNIKCFFGHGGLLGLSEATYVGVPLLIMPMFGDQFYNAYTAKARGVAEVLIYNDLNEQSLREALNKVFNDTSYRENARMLSRAYRDRPASPLETAVWWTEYIARSNGRPYVRSKSADLSWYQHYLIDVALVLIVVCAVLIYIVFRLIKLLLSLLSAVKGKPGSETRDKGKRRKED